MWEINSISQLLSLLYSAILGGIFCLMYDLLRAARASVKFSFTAVLITDILFSVICGFLMFCFLLAVTLGEIRGYILVGTGMGFVIFRLTLSKLLFPIFKKIVKLFLFLKKQIHKLLCLVFCGIYKGFVFLREKVLKILKFALNSLKKGLKRK